MVDELRLALLGGLRITRASLQREGDAPLPGLTTHKGQALLCYLALTRRAHTRDTLASLLWSDDPQEEARASLRNALFLLRKVASPYLAVTRNAVAFNHESPYRLDVEVFRDKLASAGAAHARDDPNVLATLREAIDIYQGEFLEGFYVPGASVFEEWVLTERQRLHGMAIEALYRLSGEYAHLGETLTAITYLNRLLVLEPWREEARRDLMRLLAETGQRSAAISEYETCRRILLTELGVEPSEETTALYKQILAGEISPRPSEIAPQSSVLSPQSSVLSTKSPSNLPAALTPLLGREMELLQLGDRLQRPTLRLLTLVGEGGIGKTRLAVELASRLLPTFPDGLFYVPLAAVRDVELVPSAIAQALKLQEGTGRSYLDALKEWLTERKVLLVLDNFEQILDATGTIIELLQSAPDLKVLVTSREPLATIGEHVFPVAPLPVPDPAHITQVERLGQNPSVALFCERAEAVRFGFALAEDNAPSVTDICRRLDGSPLAIELAAAQAGGIEVDEIARRLNDRFLLLAKGNRAAPDRHQTLRGCIEWSYDLLAEGDRHLFRGLSVFAGGWTMEAAVAVCGPANDDGRRVLSLRRMDDEASIVRRPSSVVQECMQRLVDKSLVVLDSETGRYGMHESIRHYATFRLEEAGEAEALYDRHLHYFTELAETADQQMAGPGLSEWLNRLDSEHNNLRAAFDQLHDRNGEAEENAAVAMRLAGSLWRFWVMRGYIEEGSRRLQDALAAYAEVSPQPDDSGQSIAASSPHLTALSKALNGAGVLAHSSGDIARAYGYLEQCLAVRRALGDKKGIASALNNLAQVVISMGDLPEARLLIEESLHLKRELGDKPGTVNSLSSLGNIAFNQGDYAAARLYYEEALALAREIQHTPFLVNGLSNLGRIYLETGELARAGPYFEESLALARELDDKPGIGQALGSQGQLAADQGDHHLALSLQTESLELLRQAGHLREAFENLRDIALAVGALGRTVEASRLLGASEAARAAIDYRLTPADSTRLERGLAVMRSVSKTDPERLEEAYAEGLAMSLEQAIAYALQQSIA
jgi:predicted ATPase/DNA-binding SARP family transcriptional activator